MKKITFIVALVGASSRAQSQSGGGKQRNAAKRQTASDKRQTANSERPYRRPQIAARAQVATSLGAPQVA